MRRLFDDNWLFYEAAAGAECDVSALKPVDLPHDALIGKTDGLYRNCDLYYVRNLSVTEAELDGCVLLEFGGVYMDCDIIANGVAVLTHRYGYTSFTADITSFLTAGENELMVKIRHRQPSGRWYTGAGIYRDVYINFLPARHIVPDGIRAFAKKLCSGKWQLEIHTESGYFPVKHVLYDKSGAVAGTAEDAGSGCAIEVNSPDLWSCDAPCVYTLESSIPGQTVTQHTGFREVKFTADQGMLLNGKHVKLRGVCLHHDQGALGSAFVNDAERRRLMIMRDMGVNALRTSHNPPDPQLMDLCDELGVLVIDEAFDTWKRPKGEYDYSRFFEEDFRQDVALWVRRDRNHPSLIMWSIGNEILDTNLDESAQQITRQLRDEVRRHDPDGQGAVTIGSNFMAWENARKCADFVDLQGYNYGEKYYDAHHAEHPGWVIYGSETSSLLGSRGVYHFPMSVNSLSDEDLQCSSLGNSCTSWGTQNLQKCITDDLNNEYSLGQFLWSGTDYIGEPTPYHTRSCYFGMTDTACFPKDTYYRFRAAWNDAPTAHIGVSWDWNAGQLIDVPVMTNAKEAELFLNGASLGKKAVNRLDADTSLPVWQVPFEKGVLEAVCRFEDGSTLTARRETPGEAAVLRVSIDRQSLPADGRSLAFVEISACDAEGRPVDNACDSVHVSVTGGGRLMGLDNGDSDSDEEYQTTSRRLFSGKLLAIIGSNGKHEAVSVKAEAPGLKAAECVIESLPAEITEGVSCGQQLCPEKPVSSSTHARRVDIETGGSRALTPDKKELRLTARVFPPEAAQEITWSCVTASGIPSPCALIRAEGSSAVLTATGDGTVYVRACASNGRNHPRVISSVEITAEGFGAPDFDPYEFVSAGLYTASEGITPGNEHGVAFARDGESWAEYARVDFGRAGSDRVTLPIFALDSGAYEMRLYADGELIAVLPYQKPSQWNVYQSETYTLPRRLTGLKALRFVMDKKVHLRGFVFEKQSRAAQRLCAAQADAVYGDSFTVDGESVKGIGNNVTLTFDGLDFGNARRTVLSIEGHTPLDANPITLVFTDISGTAHTRLIRFDGGGGTVQKFPMDIPGGVLSAGFVFLPGSNFDFTSIQFTDTE